MNLAQDVYTYYFTNKDQLSDSKLFHFATRTAAWTGAPESYQLLRDCANYIVEPSRAIDSVIADILNAPQTGRRNAHELRQPFFEKYPKLYGAHLALFRVRHLQEVYGIDARESLFKGITEHELIELRDALLADTQALKILSTFAINFCYLLERVIFRNHDSLPLERFLNIDREYDTAHIEQIQLLIYFYTHCIIGESNFYVQEIPTQHLIIYTKMLEKLEPLIRDNFHKINLDNKLEFLVCARICNFKTDLFIPIYEECSKSISPEGTFLIDVHNENIQADRNDFSASEHRNVLFIMSSSEYRPNSTLVA